MPEIKVLVEGGKATAGAPLGPALGPTGVNIKQVVDEINEKTKNFAGIKVPVKVIIDPAKKGFEIEVGSPPTSSLIIKEAKADKGAANPKTEVKGNLAMEQVKKIAEMKFDSVNSYSLGKAMREVIGTCNSMGVTVEGKPAKEIQQEIRSGKWKDALSE
ncbi:MAG: 50S ribosomal protein L11 [archaeon]|nr:50S ribosomal protein L11 [archaeon]